MRRHATLLLSLGFAFAMFANAQADPPPTEPGAVPLPGPNQAMVRLVHASPNTEVDRVVLTDAGAVGHHEFTDIEYLDATEYVPVLAGSYDIVVELAPTDDARAAHVVERQTLTTIVGNYYTIVLTGLALPGEVVGTDDGFLAWLEELFTAERQDLSVFPMVLDDLTQIALLANEAEVRLVHAAPGVEPIELFFVGPAATDQFLHREAYGNWSPHNRIFPAQGHLQLRMADTNVVLMDLDDVDIQAGMIHTVIVTGTPIEDEPLRAIIVSNPWVDPIATTPVTPGVAPRTWGWGALPAAETTWVYDRLFQAQTWLESAEARLAGVDDVDEAAAAMDEVNAARAAIEQVMAQFGTVGAPAPGVVAPVEPVDEDEEAAD